MANAFGAGVDYLVIENATSSGGAICDDVDDLAFDPLDGARPAELASEDLRTLIAEGAEGEGMDVDVFFDRLDQEIGALHHPSAKVE